MSDMTSQQHLMQLEMMIHMIQMKCNFLLMESDGIHPGQIALLMTMRDMGPTNQRALARSMNCSAASVGVSVKRLERAGLLRKQADEQDMRTTRVALTQQGQDFAKRCEELVNAVAEKKYAGLGEEDLDRLEDYLTRISANLEGFHAELAARKQDREPSQEEWEFSDRWGAHDRRAAGEWDPSADGSSQGVWSRPPGRRRECGRNPSGADGRLEGVEETGGAGKTQDIQDTPRRRPLNDAKNRKKANDTGEQDDK